MTSDERALRALQALVQFELVQASAAVAQAMTICGGWQQRADGLASRSESASCGLRSALGEQPVNPELLGAMRRVYRQERDALDDAQAHLVEAGTHEQQVRDALTGLRNRDLSLERAVQSERRKCDLKNQARQIALADDLWLQKSWREPT